MSGDDQREAVLLDLAHADEELQAARYLLDVGLARVSLTRSYFAVFHAVRARLYAAGLQPRTPSSVLNLWSLHLVKPGHYEPATSRLLARLQKFREEADYADAFIVDEAGAREELEAARELVERIRNELG